MLLIISVIIIIWLMIRYIRAFKEQTTYCFFRMKVVSNKQTRYSASFSLITTIDVDLMKILHWKYVNLMVFRSLK